ncbi:integral membrane protein [Pontibacter aydingkolensis]|uniref:DUF3817 domain-containing protein n=1 Tax=Pontibacter aydingkolensis TaxID=1911536 RepID=A0ABS7CY72_9BACT|nr:DUF3817 domain-containing protein [Pontibacter aydingkolensis]MBW7468789.1 DUF3817 domain-containing protein [Pontibacter aydingkolensis]
MKTPISRFRLIGFYEGLSFLLLLGIAMPVKYILGYPELVKYTGWAHGVLFILYMYALLQVALVHRWSVGKIALGAVASLLPFGPFILDKKLLQKEERVNEPEQKAKQSA